MIARRVRDTRGRLAGIAIFLSAFLLWASIGPTFDLSPTETASTLRDTLSESTEEVSPLLQLSEGQLGTLDAGLLHQPTIQYEFDPVIVASDGPPDTPQDVASLAVSEDGAVNLVWRDLRKGQPEVRYAVKKPSDVGFQASILVSGVDTYAAWPTRQSLSLGFNDTVHVVWHAFEEGAMDVFYSRLNETSGTFDTPVRVNDVTDDDQAHAVIAAGEGTVHVAWNDGRGGQGDSHIYYAFKNESMSNFSQSMRVDTSSASALTPSIALGNDGTIHIAWKDTRLGGSVRVFYASVVSGTVMPDMPVNPNPSGSENYPSVTVDHGGLVSIAWYGGGKAVLATRHPSDANFSSPVALDELAGSAQLGPFVIAPEEGLILAVWKEGNADGLLSCIVFGGRRMDQGHNLPVSRTCGEAPPPIAIPVVSALNASKVHLAYGSGGLTQYDVYYTSGIAVGDSAIYRWDLDLTVDADGDGNATNDADVLGRSVNVTYGDDGLYRLMLNVEERGQFYMYPVTVEVTNVPPDSVDHGSVGIPVDLSFRIAGEKWHDVEILLYEDGLQIGYASITRHPGSPNDQMVTLADISIDFSNTYSAVAHYTPEDDPVNGQIWGATPAWVILEYENGQERMHHTFNVRHEETWTWVIDDLSPHFLGHDITFVATASDPGSDDLTFTWNWGDGTSTEHTYYNDGVGPDPYPSPEVNPITVTDTARHSYAFPGTYIITLTIMDDDGGVNSYSLDLTL
ncbi:MAG: PKD domain-containing protein [Thermoplasmata archaeon]|nr:PKD domain-containing protein [Thermoplasmata archaeon]